MGEPRRDPGLHPVAAGSTATVPRLFESLVEAQPEAPALSTGGSEFSYHELNQRANGIAAAIEAAGLSGGQSPIGFLLDAGWGPVAAILAILKTGNIFVPLDPAMPAERLRSIVAHSGMRLLLVDDETDGLARPDHGELQLELLRLDQCPIAGSNPQGHGSARDAAYIYYTSGTTGAPKGVVHDHRNIIRWAQVDQELYGLGPQTRGAHLFRYGFAAARTATFDVLLAGGQLYLYPFRAQGLTGLLPWLRSSRIDFLHLGPSLFRSLVAASRESSLPDLDTVMLSGEEVRRHDVEAFRSRVDTGAVLVNRLASTEAGAIAQFSMPPGARLGESLVPIGKPITRLVEVVLGERDAQGYGEMFVRGKYLSTGYWNDPEETAASYKIDEHDPDLRTFRTGDLVSQDGEGNLVFRGRQDRVVKVRGFRVELGSVEEMLLGYLQVRDAVVLPRDSENLAAFVVPANGGETEALELRKRLERDLPPQMVPGRIVLIDSIPLTPTGKLDSLSLLQSLEEDSQQLAPAGGSDGVELYIIKLWEKVLKTGPVSPQDDFFELGGNSLAAARVTAAIELKLGVTLPLALFLENPTPAGLTAAIEHGAGDELWSTIVPLKPQGTCPPLYIVHGIGGNILHMHSLVQVAGPDQPYYGIQARGLDGRSEPFRSIPAMAEHYARAIQGHQPQGPYMVGGYSFGGNVALEIACQLQDRGEQVAALVLFDTRFRRSLLSEDRPLLLSNKSWRQLRKVSLSPAFLFRLPPHRWRQHVGKQIRILSRIVRRTVHRLRREIINKPRKMRDYHHQALKVYKRRSFSGDMIFVRAALRTDLRPRRGDRRVEEWGRLVGGAVHVIDVGGSHADLFTEPFVAAMVEQLEQELGKALGRQPAADAAGPTPGRLA